MNTSSPVPRRTTLAIAAASAAITLAAGVALGTLFGIVKMPAASRSNSVPSTVVAAAPAMPTAPSTATPSAVPPFAPDRAAPASDAPAQTATPEPIAPIEMPAPRWEPEDPGNVMAAHVVVRTRHHEREHEHEEHEEDDDE